MASIVCIVPIFTGITFRGIRYKNSKQRGTCCDSVVATDSDQASYNLKLWTNILLVHYYNYAKGGPLDIVSESHGLRLKINRGRWIMNYPPEGWSNSISPARSRAWKAFSALDSLVITQFTFYVGLTYLAWFLVILQQAPLPCFVFHTCIHPEHLPNAFKIINILVPLAAYYTGG